MRFVIVGLGGIGGVLAARLRQGDHRVVGVARGQHLSAIREHGLRLDTPTESYTADIEVYANPSEASIGDGDVVVVAVKSQDTAATMSALSANAPAHVPVLCAQNGVHNEPFTLRFFSHVYGVVVMCPTAFLHPGVVQAYSTPVTGLLDVGRYPAGEDDVTRAVTAILNSATYDARSISDVRRWKYAKLLTNLGNAVEAVCGPAARPGQLTELLQTEGERVLQAAGIEYASAQEDKERRGDLLKLRPIDGHSRPGGSAWQSLARQAGGTEVDYLCGEVVMLGRLHGVATPANSLMQQLTTRLAHERAKPGLLPVEEVLARLDHAD